MEIFISNRISTPIYEQISSQIKALIIGGQLQAGEALPSIRGLAKVFAYQCADGAKSV